MEIMTKKQKVIRFIASDPEKKTKCIKTSKIIFGTRIINAISIAVYGGSIMLLYEEM
jgi:hypothetical protein